VIEFQGKVEGGRGKERKVNNQRLAKTAGKGGELKYITTHVTYMWWKQRKGKYWHICIYLTASCSMKNSSQRGISHEYCNMRVVCCRSSIPALLLVGKCIHFYKRNKKDFERNEGTILFWLLLHGRRSRAAIYNSRKTSLAKDKEGDLKRKREREREREKIEQASDNGSRE